MKDSSVVERNNSKKSRKSSKIRKESEPEWKKTASKIPDIPNFEELRPSADSEYVGAIVDDEISPEKMGSII